MESYYDSDEEIAWGPVTLREIKGDLKRVVTRKPNRRHTVICNIENCKMDDEALAKDTDKLNISGTSTAYFTPNESLKTSNNSDFLEKLSSVINMSNSDLSKYASVIEDSTDSTNKSEEQKSIKESQIMPVIIVSEASPEDNSCQKFINAFKNRNTCYDIEKFQQTLVENTYILSEDEVTTEENIGEEGNHFETEENLVEEEIDEIIVISDDSDSSINNSNDNEDLDCDRIITLKKENVSVTYKNSCTERNKAEYVEVSFESSTHDQKPVDRFSEERFEEYNCIEQHESFESDIEDQKQADLSTGNDDGHSDVCEENNLVNIPNCIEKHEPRFESAFEDQKQADLSTGDDDGDCDVCEENSLFKTPNRLSTVKEYLSTSPVIVPDIDFQQFDDSSSKDDSLQLNDTLEEMNRFLSQGINYSMPDDEIVDNTPTKRVLSPQNIITPLNQIVPSNKQLSSKGKDKASHIPRGKFAHSENKTIKKETGPNMTPKTDFKVPITPLRTKLATPKHGSNLKNVVSPVALYIKNSPRVPLIKHIHLGNHSKNLNVGTTSTKVAPSNKENFPYFPEVVYKPSKKQIASTERHVVVPSYMKNLRIKESQITKHEGRIKQNLESTFEVRDKLLESDITNITVDQSLLDNTGNISVLTSKQAFIK